ncbi:MAG TPA: copper transporter, partial [Desulfotomaculum sp.]|nr:copper transporter [Desulfotomaculum sp.]
MIINLRYHIASLVATFLALGIGILIGSIMLGNDTLVKQQQQLTRKLELQIEELRKKNEAVQAIVNNLETSNDVKEQFEKQSLPFLLAGRLSGYQVAIVEINNYRFLPEFTETLKTSGVTVSSVTTIFSDPGFDQEEIQSFWGQKDLTPELITRR